MCKKPADMRPIAHQQHQPQHQLPPPPIVHSGYCDEEDEEDEATMTALCCIMQKQSAIHEAISRNNAPPLPSSSISSSSSSSSKTGETGVFESLSSSHQLLIMSLGMFLFFGAHNLLQEAMVRIEGFNGVMLGYLEVLAVTTCSCLERKYVAKETGRVAPLSSYPLLTVCLLSSAALSNMSLDYINFPTKVVFRSCKLVPTMIIATVMNSKTFRSSEYVCALAVCAGLVMFAAADWKLTPSFNPVGLILVSASVVADSILPNAQERLFRLGSSRLEVTVYTNFFTLMVMTVTTLASGDLIGLFQRAMYDSQLALYMVAYTAISYLAISSYMAIVKRFSGVTAVLLATARKGMTLVLSFLLFPKDFSWFYVAGATFVLGGLLVASTMKHYYKQRVNDGDDVVGSSATVVEKDLEAGNRGTYASLVRVGGSPSSIENDPRAGRNSTVPSVGQGANASTSYR